VAVVHGLMHVLQGW